MEPNAVKDGLEAEAIFEEYLRGRGISWQYERPAGPSHPDYWLDVPAQPVCEVRYVTAYLPGPDEAVGAYKPIARAVKRKARQGRALAGVQPYVVVIWAPRWPTHVHVVAGALFGRVQIVMPFSPSTGTADSDQAQLGFGRNAILHGNQHKHVSAVVVIERFNPGLRAVENEIDAEVEQAGADLEPHQVAEITMGVFEGRTRARLFEHRALLPRLVTFHNMHATTPLPLDVFDGPFDEQYSARYDGSFTLVFEGEQVPKLPR